MLRDTCSVLSGTQHVPRKSEPTMVTMQTPSALSPQEFLDRADALVLHANDSPVPRQGTSLKAGRPVFTVRPPQYATPEIIAFVRERLTKN